MLPARIWIVVSMMAYVVLQRLFPYLLQQAGIETTRSAMYYPWNFSPLTAICLFGAAHFAQRRWAFLVALGALGLSDLAILLVAGKDYAIYPGRGLVYACFVLTTCLGLSLRQRTRIAPIAGAAILAEFVFFLVTNLGVWYACSRPAPMMPESFAVVHYTPDFNGIGACYVAGLPFFRLSLASTAIYTTLLFGGLAYVRNRHATRDPATVLQTGV
jgi:hypothetical protein